MKIELIKQTIGDECSFKYLSPIKYCCKELKNSCIVLSNGYDDMENAKMCIEKEDIMDWELCIAEPIYKPIDYCPFCGEKIDCKIIKNEDLSHEFAIIEKYLEDIEQELEKNDSVQREKRLNNTHKILNKRINEMFQITEYKENKISLNNLKILLKEN